VAVNGNILSPFHELVQRWFVHRFGSPTDVQEKAWPVIAAGKNVLITAPTGSGKTLTAFLWALNGLISGTCPAGQTRILYVSPLKALNNDVQQNLMDPLSEIGETFRENGFDFPEISVLTRSGDTPQTDRRRMLRHPPGILITTPESLNLMLSSQGGRSVLTHVSTVILDEIHSVISSKRGTYLISAVDRLAALAGEFQRIALSATIKPLDTVAEFVGGYAAVDGRYEPVYEKRPVKIIRSAERKRYAVSVKFPVEAAARFNPAGLKQKSVWEPIVELLRKVIARNRSTLVFVNSRRLCEKITFMINNAGIHPVAYAHHGSLSKELRRFVEQKLKSGDLKAIVATNSLELGIDIGSLDQVLLIQTPPSISSGIQRVGRAGHRVGQTSSGSLIPTHAHDFIESAVLARGIVDQDIEQVRPVLCPLDVLAQIIISMAGTETWHIDGMHHLLRTTYPYHHLSRNQFDLVVNMLSGRYAGSRIRELKPRISVDRLDGTVQARKGALLALYMSGGVIPDRGYFHLRHYETNAKIGELDEEFVWEAKPGQTFTLGTQNWRIERITHNDVRVLPGNPNKTAPPFWIAEESRRNFHFSEKIGRFLERAEACPDDADLGNLLENELQMTRVAAEELVAFLKKQKKETGAALPHRHHLLIEHVTSGPSGYPGNQLILHTLWGGCVNRPFAMALEAAYEETFAQSVEIYADNNCIYMILPHDIPDPGLLSMVNASNLESLIRRRLEGSGFFGARFRECAGRALLISRRKIKERMPLWISRLKSQKLLDAVATYGDFPILLETWRTCLDDIFDIENLTTLLLELETGKISWTSLNRSQPSPMAMGGAWRQINQYMYQKDSGVSSKRSGLRDDLIQEVVVTPGLRPTVAGKIVELFEEKRQRLSPGYAPDSAGELLEWVKERILIPESEWALLMDAIRRDHDLLPEELIKEISGKLLFVFPERAEEKLVIPLEAAMDTILSLYGTLDEVVVEPLVEKGDRPVSIASPIDADPKMAETGENGGRTRIIGEWLSFYGPVSPEFIPKKLGIPDGRVQTTVKDLADAGRVVMGTLITGGGEEDVCDRENLEILLRLSRAAAIPPFEPLMIDNLPVFLSVIQKTAEPAGHIDRLHDCIEQMICFPARAELWEMEILPARIDPYDPSWMDTAVQESDLKWIGGEGRKILFCFESDLDLLKEENTAEDRGEGRDGGADSLFPDARGKYDFSTLLSGSGRNPSSLLEALWNRVWAGRITNDAFVTLRKGIENRFKLPDAGLKGGRSRPAPMGGRRFGHGGRSGFSRWQGALPATGNWHKISFPQDGNDLIEQEEKKKDRVRILLERYGVLFRELIARELPEFRWGRIFRSLRLMELSGEILSGYFFSGINGPQFTSRKGLQILQHHLGDEKVFWLNAMDPGSLCGVSIDGLTSELPKRLPGNHMVYKGKKVVLVSRRNGAVVTFYVPVEDPRIPEYLQLFHHLLNRRFQPLRQVSIETINGVDALKSPFVDAFKTAFDVVLDHKRVVLYRKQ